MKLDVIGFAAINGDKIKYMEEPVEEYETYSSGSAEGLPYDELFLGGSVTNTLVGLTKFGFEVGIIGKVGDDEVGKFLLDRLRLYKVRFLGKKVRGSSGIAYIRVGTSGRRSITIYPGVNDMIQWIDVLPFVDEIKNVSLLHTATFACAFERYDSLRTQIEVAKIARKVSLNLGMLYCDLHYKERKLIDDLLRHVDILILNRQEIERLTGLGYEEASKKLMEKYGIEIIAVTLESEGSAVFAGDEEHLVPSFEVEEVVDMTGAGDAFTAGFLAAYLRGKDVKTCARLGNLVATSCIQTRGAVDYALPKEAIESVKH